MVIENDTIKKDICIIDRMLDIMLMINFIKIMLKI